MTSVIVGLISVVVSLCLLLYFRQDSLLFFPGPNDSALAQQWKWRRVEIGSGSHVLEGWWADAGDPSSSSVILFFGGNAEDVLHSAVTAERLNVRRMLVVNYRGYGGTKGRPSQEALFEDARAVYDYAIDAGGVGSDNVIVMGRSLGSGVATMLAAQRKVRAAILITPYDSMVAVAQRHYPFMPIRLLLRHPFPSRDYAGQTNAPVLMLAAARDFVIPPVHAQRLFEVWAGAKSIHVLSDVGHNDIEQHPDYYPLINEFLARLDDTGDRARERGTV